MHMKNENDTPNTPSYRNPADYEIETRGYDGHDRGTAIDHGLCVRAKYEAFHKNRSKRTLPCTYFSKQYL